MIGLVVKSNGKVTSSFKDTETDFIIYIGTNEIQ